MYAQDISFSVKEKQIEAVVRMLNFNIPSEQSQHWQEVWKVLVFDKYCSDVVSLLLKKGDLRNQGITLHLLLHSDRQAITDVPSIYFVAPNKDNIRRICEDCKYHLYDSFYVNFSSAIPRPLLEEFASSTVQSESSQLVSKVFDQYLNFLSLEKDLFCFNTPSSYLAFNDPTLSDAQAEANVEAVIEGLLSVLVTMGVVPIIRAPKNSAAEQVARGLDARLHQHLSSASTSFNSDPMASSSHNRPLLVILDRNIDLTVMLNHSWTYQALVHDLLNMQLNRVTIPVQEGEKTVVKTYDLDQDIDSFWSDNTATPFQNVGGAVKEQFNKYTESMEQLNKLKKLEMDANDAAEDEKVNLLNSKTKGLSQIVSNLPELQEKNAIIERHSNIATAIMKQVKDREIDSYFEHEEAIITKSLLAPKEMINLICNEGRGTPEDKLRLFLIYFLSTKTIAPAEMEQLEEALTKMGADLGPLKYIKKTKAFNEGLLATLNAAPSTKGSSFANFFAGTIAQGTGYEAVDRLSSMFSTSVRSLLPKSKDLYVSRVVGSLMEMKNTLNVEDSYLYLDPKSQSRGGNIHRKNTPFSQAIVFTVGGGNYVEYQNLLDYAKKMQPAKKIIYGTTEMLTPHDFLQQLSAISKK